MAFPDLHEGILEIFVAADQHADRIGPAERWRHSHMLESSTQVVERVRQWRKDHRPQYLATRKARGWDNGRRSA